MNVCVIGGAGYVGLITGIGLAEIGHQVTNVDVDHDRITRLQRSESPFFEPGIEPVLKRNVSDGRLCFSTDLPFAIASSEIAIVAVGTPHGKDGRADLSQIVQVVDELHCCIDAYKLIVVKSTVPVGTLEIVRKTLARNRKEGEDFDIAVNPEFLREGSGIQDFFYPDRIVIGTYSERARRMIRELYEPVIQGKVFCIEAGPGPNGSTPIPLVETDPASAQMIKYASNAFLAARVSFINEIADLCEGVGADIRQVSQGMGFDPRIGSAYLEPGLGFGGPCLEKDLRALMTMAEGSAHETPLLKGVLERNERQVDLVTNKLKCLVGESFHGKTLAAFGVSFKAGTNDVRNSLALRVINRLANEGATVRLHDPEARVCNGFLFFEDPYETVKGAHGLVILTEWPCFKNLDYSQIRDSMVGHNIVDARNLLDAKELRNLGFTYSGIGGV